MRKYRWEWHGWWRLCSGWYHSLCDQELVALNLICSSRLWALELNMLCTLVIFTLTLWEKNMSFLALNIRALCNQLIGSYACVSSSLRSTACLPLSRTEMQQWKFLEINRSISCRRPLPVFKCPLHLTHCWMYAHQLTGKAPRYLKLAKTTIICNSNQQTKMRRLTDWEPW